MNFAGKKIIRAADLFCGGEGTTTGMIWTLGYGVELTAVKYWNVAIAMCRINHPNARHWYTNDDKARFVELFVPGELEVPWASPEYISHSLAHDGRPVSDQRRATAFCMCRLGGSATAATHASQDPAAILNRAEAAA
ncbi:MAG: hypothetical protein V4710_05450 [Verrucomicrobiota bacterium]